MNVLNLLLHRNGGSKHGCLKGHLLIYLLLATQPIPNLARSEFCPVVQGDVPHQKRLFVATSDASGSCRLVEIGDSCTIPYQVEQPQCLLCHRVPRWFHAVHRNPSCISDLAGCYAYRVYSCCGCLPIPRP